MGEQIFGGQVGRGRGGGEDDKRSVANRVLQTVFDIRLQIVLIAKPAAEAFRFLALQIVQIDFAELPISKQQPFHGSAGDNPGSDDAECCLKGVGGNVLCRQCGGGGGSRGAYQ